MQFELDEIKHVVRLQMEKILKKIIGLKLEGLGI